MGSKTATKGKTTAATKTTTTKSKPSAKRPARTRPGDARAKPGKARAKPGKAASKPASKPEPVDLAAMRRELREALNRHSLAVADLAIDYYARIGAAGLDPAGFNHLMALIKLCEAAMTAAEVAVQDQRAEREEIAAATG